MTQNKNRKNINEVRIEFVAPIELKEALQVLVNERNITLSALLRLVAFEYVKHNQIPRSSQLQIKKEGWLSRPQPSTLPPG